MACRAWTVSYYDVAKVGTDDSEVMKNHLTEIFDKHGTDKGSAQHDLGHIYEPFFQSIPIKRVIEIGVYHGASVNAFAEYFGSESCIVGIDTQDRPNKYLENVSIVIGDATKANVLALAASLHNYEVDLVLDDASHNVLEQIATMKGLVRYVVDDGLYIVEDVRINDVGSLLIELPSCLKVVGWHRYPRNPDFLTCICKKG